MSWLATAKAHFSQKAKERPAKTDESGVSSVLAAPTTRAFEIRNEVSSVSSVGVAGFLENCISIDELIATAMRACDHHGDGEAAREAMRQDCINTPPHLRAGLLAYFNETYPVQGDAE